MAGRGHSRRDPLCEPHLSKHIGDRRARTPQPDGREPPRRLARLDELVGIDRDLRPPGRGRAPIFRTRGPLMARNSFRRPLALLALVLGLGLVGAVVYRPWEASGAASAPIIGVVAPDRNPDSAGNRRPRGVHSGVSRRTDGAQRRRSGDAEQPRPCRCGRASQGEPRLSERQPGQCRMPASARKKSTRRRRTFGSPTPISRSRSNSTNAPRNSRPRISRASSNWTRATEALGSAEAELGQVQGGLRPEQGRSDQGGAGDR